MKKRVSLLLILSIMLTVLAPMLTYAANTDEAEKLYDYVQRKHTGDVVLSEAQIKSLLSNQKVKDLLKNAGNNMYEGIKAEFDKNSKAEKYVKEHYKLNLEYIKKLIDETESFVDTNYNGAVEKFIVGVLRNEKSLDVSSLESIQTYLKSMQKILNESSVELGGSGDWEADVIKKGTKLEVLDVFYTFVKDSLSGAREVCLGTDRSLEIVLKGNLDGQIESMLRSLGEFIDLPSIEEPGRIDKIETFIKDYVVKINKKIEDEKVYVIGMRTQVEAIVKGFGFDFIRVDCPPVTPPGPGTDPGTGPGGQTQPPISRYRTQLGNATTPSRVFLDNEKHFNIVTDKNTKNVVVTIHEDDIIRAIAQLKQEVKDKNLPMNNLKLVITMPEEEGFNIDFVMTGKAASALKKDNIAFKVEGDRGTIIIPSGGLGATTFDDKELVKLVIDEIENRVAAGKVRDEDAMKQAMDIYISRVKDGKSTRIDKLVEPMVFELNIKGLGDTDILAFYSIEDGMKFITGKIKNSKMTYSLTNLGEHALVETYITYGDTRNHWARESIKSMTAKNVVNGVGRDLFKPNENVTRAEFAKMIVASLETDLLEYNNEFKDVKKSSWYAPYVATAHKLGIVEGVTKDNFKPNENITREEMATMLSRLDDDKLTEDEIKVELDKYKDADKVSEWAKPYVAKASKLNIMTGKKIGLDPLSNATRAEAATMIFRIYSIY